MASQQQTHGPGLVSSTIRMFKRLYSMLSSLGRRQGDENISSALVVAPPSPPATTSRPTTEEGMETNKRARTLHPPTDAQGQDKCDSFSALPEECLCEIVSYLDKKDIWPAVAFLSKKLSRAPGLVPVLLEACPSSDVFQAYLSFAETADCHSSCSLISSLSASRRGVGDNGACRLAKNLEAFPGLRHISLENNGLGLGGVEALVGALSGSAVASSEATSYSVGDAAKGKTPRRAGSRGRKRASSSPSSSSPSSSASSCSSGGPPSSTSTGGVAALRGPVCPLLDTLDLSHNGIADGGMHLLSHALSSAHLPRLQTLRLEGCGFSGAGGLALAEALGSCHVARLETLDLCGNDFGPEGTRAVADVLGNGACPALSTLKLRDTRMRAEGAVAVGEAIARGPLASLTSLDLEGNGLGDKGVQALAAAWGDDALPGSGGQAAGHRAAAAATSVPFSSDASASASASALDFRTTPRLETLRLARNALGEKGAAHLCPALLHCPRLKVLDLAMNGLTTQALAFLFAPWQYASPLSPAPILHLEDLDLAGNRLAPPGICALTRTARIGSLPHLTRLSLQGCGIEESGALELSAAFVPSPSLPRGGLPSLRILMLGCNRLGSAGLASLAVAISGGGAKKIERLGLNGNEIGDAGASALASAISGDACPALQHLELFGNSIQSEGLRRLAVAFRARSRGLKTLDLGRPSQGPVGIQALGAYFLAAVMNEGAFPALTHLHLGGNGIGRSGVYMLHIALRNHGGRVLESLDLSGNSIGDIGGSYLAIAFRRGGCPGLRTLRLGGCGLGDAGLSRIVHAFIWRPREQRKVAHLSLANNNLSADGFTGLFAQIRAGGFPELETLQLERNRGGARGFSALGEAFACNGLPLLQALNVADNRASDEGLASLSSSLKARAGKGKVLPLRVLQLGGNEITGAGVGPLADSLISGACPCLEELDLRRNHLGHEGGEALARVLRSDGCPVLADLDLSSSQLSVEGMRAVVEVLQEGRGAMRRVSFEHNGGGSEAAALVDSLMGPRGHNPACPLLVSCTV